MIMQDLSVCLFCSYLQFLLSFLFLLFFCKKNLLFFLVLFFSTFSFCLSIYMYFFLSLLFGIYICVAFLNLVTYPPFFPSLFLFYLHSFISFSLSWRILIYSFFLINFSHLLSSFLHCFVISHCICSLSVFAFFHSFLFCSFIHSSWVFFLFVSIKLF